jgi:hypothetical protein
LSPVLPHRTPDSRRVSPRARVAVLAVALLLAALGVLGVALRPTISPVLYGWTGEEDYWEQIKGSVALGILTLRRPRLDTREYEPITHAGNNPLGINTFLEQEAEPHKVELALAMIHAAGFRWIRQEFPWEDIEISGKGDFWDHKWGVSAWAKYDRLVNLADEYGLEIIARLDNPPAWSREAGDTISSLGPPDDYDDFGDFVSEIVGRYKGRIRHYQIWNEPNTYREWGNRPVSAEQYVDLLEVAYNRAKEADPECVVLSAGLAQTLEKGPENLDDLIYLQQMYDAGAAACFDIMGVMAYGLWTGPTDRRASPDRTNFARPQLIREIMVGNGDAHKPIWVTEVGWNALPLDFPEFPNFGRVTLDQQARYAVEAYERAQREWPWMGVMNYWFFKRATDGEKDQTFYYFRMVEPDFTPLPVYDTMRAYANRPPVMHIGYHQEDHWAIEWNGSWQAENDDGAVLGSYAVGEAGDSLEVVFDGAQLHLVTMRAPEMGSLLYSIDGSREQRLTLSSTTSEHQATVNLAQNAGDGESELRLVVQEGPVVIDGFLVKR